MKTRVICSILLVILLGGLLFAKNGSSWKIYSTSPLQQLIEGNERFARAESTHPRQTVEVRKQLMAGQRPFAVIVSCSDSRVPPELIFDQGLGDLFVIRVAGNVVDSVELDSVEFAVQELQVPLVLVLGHQSCGAVKAVVKGDLESLRDLEDIEPYLQEALEKSNSLVGDPLENAIKMNALLMVQKLKKKPILAKQIEENKLKILAGYYRLDTGCVEILERSK